jgi:ankyrin repeat protein
LKQKNIEIIKILCNGGSDCFNKLKNNGNTLLLFAIENNYPDEIISILLNSNGKINEKGELIN